MRLPQAQPFVGTRRGHAGDVRGTCTGHAWDMGGTRPRTCARTCGMPEGHVQDSAMPEGGAPRTSATAENDMRKDMREDIATGATGVQGHGEDTARTTGGCSEDMRADNRDTDFGRAAKAQPPRAGHIGTNVGVAAGVGVCGCGVSGVWVARVSFVDNNREGQ